MPEDYIASSTDYDGMLGTLCTAASRMIDREVGYWPGYFNPTTDGETRYYDGNGEQELDIEPLVTLTSLAVSEEGNYSSSDYTTWTENTDFYVWPYNSTAQPIRRLIVDHNGDKLNWTRFKEAIKLTGIFGHAASTPEVIQQAAIMQTMNWYMKAKQGYQSAGANPSLGQMTYKRELDQEVKDMIWSYMLEQAL